MPKVRIDITKTDINNGIRFSTGMCPIALAVCRLIKPNITKSVGAVNLKIEDTVNPLPKTARTFIEEFDDLNMGEPFSFTLNIPAKYLKRKAKKKS